VVADETRVHVVDSAFEGTVRAVTDVTTGSLVRKGQKLATVFSPDVRTSLQGYLTALDTMEQDEISRVAAGIVVARGGTEDTSTRFAIERLLALGVSPQQLAEFKRTKLLPLTIDVRAPADGLVLAREVFPGRIIGPGMQLFRIADLDRVWVVADVPEADAALIRPGTEARVALPGLPASRTAVVSRVPPTFDAASQTMKVRLELPNPGAALRPEMFVDVELEVERPEALTVPADALVDAGVRKTVFVQAGEGVFEPRAVETGWRAAGRVEIRRGLEAGEVIVVSGTFMVDSESQLRLAAAGAGRGQPSLAAAGHQGSHPAAVTASARAESAATDPVCGMAVDPERARAAGRVHRHRGHDVFFCSDQCRASFAADPARYAPAHQGGEAL
jgi:Cu(I)/Ag(I) efflux system membrane fusion protein